MLLFTFSLCVTKINIMCLFCCTVCPSGQILCPNGTSFNCIYNTDVCDGVPDCADENGTALDETSFCGGTCKHNKFNSQFLNKAISNYPLFQLLEMRKLLYTMEFLYSNSGTQ